MYCERQTGKVWLACYCSDKWCDDVCNLLNQHQIVCDSRRLRRKLTPGIYKSSGHTSGIYGSIRRRHIMALSILRQSQSTRSVLSFPKWVRLAHHSIDQVESGSSDHDSHSQVNNLNTTSCHIEKQINQDATRRRVHMRPGSAAQSLSDQLRVCSRPCT